MAFFNDLIENIERTAPERLPRIGPTSEVLMYAPRRLRGDRLDAQQRAENEVVVWRARARRAESQLQALEARIRRIAASASVTRMKRRDIPG